MKKVDWTYTKCSDLWMEIKLALNVRWGRYAMSSAAYFQQEREVDATVDRLREYKQESFRVIALEVTSEAL